MRARPSTWPSAAYARNGSSTSASGQPGRQHHEHGRGHQDRDERRRDRVGEEVLDQLDVLRGDAHQVSRTAPHQISGGERVELPEESRRISASRRYAMSCASHDSSQCRSPASGATTTSATSSPPTGAPALDGEDGERAQNADADQRGDPGDPEDEREREPPAVAARLSPSSTRKYRGPSRGRRRAGWPPPAPASGSPVTGRASRRRPRSTAGARLDRRRRRRRRPAPAPAISRA